MGTVKAAAADAPPHTASVYRPIISATFSAKLRLIRLGSSTLPMAMPAPASTADKNREKTLPVARSNVPEAIKTRAISNTRSAPKRRARAGVGSEKRPRHRMGSVVSMLAPVEVRPVSRMISGSTTERLPNTGRRLQAMRIRLRASNQWVDGLLELFLDGAVIAAAL